MRGARNHSQRRRFAIFLITGGVAALVNIGARIVFNLVMSFEIAVIVAYLCGMTIAYGLARQFVFEHSNRAMRDEFARFALINVIAVIQVWLLSVGLAEGLFPRVGFSWHSHTLAHLIGLTVPVFTSYIGHKRFSFAQN